MANTIEVVIKSKADTRAIDKVNNSLGGLGGAAKGATGLVGSFGSALGGMATVAGGIITANIFGKIVSGIGAFASTGLEAVGSVQMLETSLKALLTANLMYESSTETITQAVTKQVMSQDELGIKQEELTAKLATQRASLDEHTIRIHQLTQKYGENGAATIKAVARHREMELAIEATERKLAGLSTTSTEYTEVTRTVFNQTMNQTEAMKLASKQTQDLIQFVSELAVISPFETEQVEATTKYAIQAGLGVDATKEFVPAFLDLAAAVGITSSELDFAADQLFQIRRVGKLTEIDLRQLRRLGIDLGRIIGIEMGMSIEEFNEAAADSPEIFDELFSAVARFSENTFAGTSQEMALSVKGLKSQLSDIFVIGARTFWRPLVEAVTPMVAEIFGKFSDFVFSGELAQLGQDLANTLLRGLSTASSLINIAQTLGLEAAIQTVIQMIKNAWPDVRDALMLWGTNFWSFITDTVIPGARLAFDILSDLVVSLVASSWPRIQEQLFQWGNQFWDWITDVALPTLGDVFNDVVTAINNAIAGAARTIGFGGTAGMVVGTILHALGLSTETAMMAQEMIDNLTGIISQSLSNWGTNFWSFITDTVIPGGKLAFDILSDLVVSLVANSWPRIQEQLFQWGNQFWDWITDVALPNLQGVMDDVTTRMRLAINRARLALSFGATTGEAARIFLRGLGLSSDIITVAQEMIDNLIGIISQGFSDIMAALPQTAINLAMQLGISEETIGVITNTITQTIAIFQSLTDMWIANWPIIQAAALTAWEVLQAVFAGIMAGLEPAIASFQESFNQITEVLTSLGITWGDVGSALVTAIAAVATVIGVTILAAISIVIAAISGFAAAISTVVSLWLEMVASVIAAAAGLFVYITEGLSGLKALFTGDFPAALEHFKNAFAGLATFVTNTINAIRIAIIMPLGAVLQFFDGFIMSLIGFWRTLFNTLVGGSIIPDLVNSIIGWFEILVEPILGVFETLAGGISTVLGAIFGAIAGGGDDGISIDFSGLVTTLTVTIPESLAILTEQFTLLFSTVTEQLTMLTIGPLTVFIMTFSSIYLTHIPILLATWISMTEQIIAQIINTVANLNMLITTIFQTQAAAVAMADAIVEGMKRVAESFKDAADNLRDKLIPAIKETIKEFEKLKEAAEEAARAARSAGEASKQGGTKGFQHGTSSSGFVIPPGFPNDSFLARFTSGERIFVEPRGMQNSNNREAVNNYYFNQTVNTRAEQSTVIGDFRTMQLLLGT